MTRVAFALPDPSDFRFLRSSGSPLPLVLRTPIPSGLPVLPVLSGIRISASGGSSDFRSFLETGSLLHYEFLVDIF